MLKKRDFFNLARGGHIVNFLVPHDYVFLERIQNLTI